MAMLEAAIPGRNRDDLKRLTVGRRDAFLLDMREQLFGSRVEALSSCPECSIPLDLNFDTSSIRCGEDEAQNRELTYIDGGFEIRFRLPTIEDLLLAADAGNDDLRRERLLDLCLLDARQEGKDRATHEIPEQILLEVVEKMGQEDPQADVQLSLICPQCHHQWYATFDIVSFLWQEIEGWSEDLLLQTHALASAYGWSEREIFAMSPLRRKRYLDMVRG
jgi:hypothetical protein